MDNEEFVEIMKGFEEMREDLFALERKFYHSSVILSDDRDNEQA